MLRDKIKKKQIKTKMKKKTMKRIKNKTKYKINEIKC
jgi:hypothetical protein